jgi:hypothetical protein
LYSKNINTSSLHRLFSLYCKNINYSSHTPSLFFVL